MSLTDVHERRRSRLAPPAMFVLAGMTILGFGGLLAARQIGRARGWQSFGQIVTVGRGRDSSVALTIDDGPNMLMVQSIIDTLRAHHARATFFVVGSELARAPLAGAALVAAGHELGNHSWTHRHMWRMSMSEIRREIEPTDSLIREVGQKGDIFFRPPYGFKVLALPWYLAQNNRASIMWSIEPDSYDLDAEDMVEHVLERVHPGSIILLHLWYATREESRAALGPMIDSLHARGYRVTTVRDLMR